MKHGPDLLSDLATGALDLGVEVTPDALRRLADFESLLRERAIALGLIAQSDHHRIAERHLLDCLRAVVAVRADDDLAYDIGSGAGLPGIVIGIARPDLRLLLVEPRRVRVAFLELVLERLELANISVVQGSIADVTDPADLCFARAFASLPATWAVARPRLRPGGRLVYFAGSGAPTPSLLPGATSVRCVRTPVLESSGPLTIMAR